MMWSRIRWTALLAAVAVAVGGLATSAGAANQYAGAIYTTNSFGARVNQNFFPLKEAVYLNGGPQHVGGQTLLPQGTYYFQITNPNGSVLLSLDPAVCRQVVVGTSGRVSGVVPAGGCEHLIGSHPNKAVSPNGTTPVQMFPFADTPNNGGEYKVWLIAQSSAVAGCNPTVDGDGKRLIFTSDCAKTDNFKVRRQAQPACASWVDEFSTLDTQRWQVQSGPAPGSVPSQMNVSTFSPNNVKIENGLLKLTLTQTLGSNNIWQSVGGMINHFVPCGYGTYEWTMRFGSMTNGPGSTGVNVSGGVSAGFTFFNNSEHEIVFEHSAHDAATYGNGQSSPEAVWFVNVRNTQPTNPAHDPETAGELTATEYPFARPYSGFHHYKFVWEPGKITYYIDGVVRTVHTTNVPVVPAFFQMIYFGRNFAPWGGLATAGTRHFYIDRAAYTPLCPTPMCQ